MASPGKRRETDLMKLMMADYDVQMADGDRVGEFYVKFHGPKTTPYEGGVWKVHVELPEAYPYKSPSIGFINRLYHPNVDEMSGSVCLDVINQSWSPMYDLTNIFEVFLPQLLTYPNPTDPLNGEAASLQMREPERYRQKVMDYVKKYAKPEDFPTANNRVVSDENEGDDDDDDDEEEDDDDGSDFSMSGSEDENGRQNREDADDDDDNDVDGKESNDGNDKKDENNKRESNGNGGGASSAAINIVSNNNSNGRSSNNDSR